MRVVTNGEMRGLDEETISRFEPGLVLMERAGQGIFDAIMDLIEEPGEERASIFLGRGNNAGDGLVVARLLAEAGVGVILHYMHDPEKFSPDAFKNYRKLEGLRKAGVMEEIFLYLADWEEKVSDAIEASTFVVDALLGTGIKSVVRAEYAHVIELINGSGLPVVAIDIPSGINGDTGEILGSAVIADMTVTMAMPKIGELFFPGKFHSGAIEVVDIGIPDEVIEASGVGRHVIDLDAASEDFPVRGPDAHKFQCGSLLIAAGSRRYSGAASLSAFSALRTGCGVVYLAGPESIRISVQSAFPEVIFISLPETADGAIAAEGADELLGQIRFDALALGPGLTVNGDTAAFVEKMIAGVDVPVVLDADGINSFEGRFDDLKKYSAERAIILSPHTGELKRLTGLDLPLDPAGRMDALADLVKGSGLTLVHKGAPTVIAHGSGRIDINVFGHPGLATAGSGDILTGAIAGLLAQTGDPASAARLGVYLHSRAADMAAEETGERGMTAGDCSDALSFALRELEEDRRG
ncbi:MAG: NAD(P)H-hydrate dehydratase [Bacteroidales bacterium]|nr:NAD(P)H-hydrate dehydratase [Candidatus Latescibacterota bacterium]